MNILTNVNSTFKILFSALTLSAVMMSCTKDQDYIPAPEVSGLNVIQASPTTEKLDFLVENTVANTSDLTFASKIGYLNLYSGVRKLTVTKKGSTAPIFSSSVTFKPQTAYSLFIVGKLDTAKFLILKDSASLPAAGKANIRFVHLSPDAEALSLNVLGKTENLFPAKLYRQYTTFVTVDAGDKVSFNVKDSAGNIISTLVDAKIEQGKSYTIWVKGLKAATDDTKLGVAIYTHN
jgi:hypothetical protein